MFAQPGSARKPAESLGLLAPVPGCAQRKAPGGRSGGAAQLGAPVLKPVTVLDRKAAWQAICEAQQSVRYRGPEPRPSPEEEEEQIYEIVREFRERHG